MTVSTPVDVELEAHVLAGLAVSRSDARRHYALLRGEAFIGHPLHPFIFGTLRRLHAGGGGSPGYDTRTINGVPTIVRTFDGFAEVWTAAYPSAGAPGPALALLDHVIDDAPVLTDGAVSALMELAERRAWRTILAERMERRPRSAFAPALSPSGLALLERLYRLDEALATTGPLSAGDLDDLETLIAPHELAAAR